MVTATDTNRLNGRTLDAVQRGSSLTPETRFSIGRDKVNEAIALLESDDDRQTVLRFWTYCAQRNLPRERMGKLVLKPNGKEFYSHEAVYQLLVGKRMREGANLRPMLESIEAFLDQVQPNTRAHEFIETRLHREIKAYCERARRLKRIGFIFGLMSIGKSTSGRQIALQDPSWLHTTMPERGQLGDYLRHVAGLSVMGTRQTSANVRERIIKAIPDGLIVDDADECFRSLRNTWGIDTLQFIKSIYEERERGIVIMMDNWGRDQLLNGDNAFRLGRLWRRRMAPLQLPDEPYQDDLDLFAKQVGLDPAPAREMKVILVTPEGEIEHKDSPRRLQNEIAGRDGIGVWRMLLQDAQDLADEQGKPIGWGAVLKAHALFAAMEERAKPSPVPADARRKR